MIVNIHDMTAYCDYAVIVDDTVAAIGYYTRSAAIVKSIGSWFGHSNCRIGYRHYSTNQKDKQKYKTVFRPIRKGYETFHYGVAISESVGESIIFTTKETKLESLYNFLMKKYKYPLLREWMPYFSQELSSCGCLDDACRIISDRDCNIKVDNNVIPIKELLVYNVKNLTEEKMEEVISSGLQSGSIRVSEAPSKELEFKNFDDYISKYGHTLVENLEQMMEPLSPLNGKVESVALKTKRLFPQQAACVNGILALKNAGSKYGLMIEGMGVGKTIQGASVTDAFFNAKYLKQHPKATLKDAYKSGEVAYRNIVMAPGHLVEKWKEEIEAEIPQAKGIILDDFSQLIDLTKDGPKRMGKEFYLISKDFAKLGDMQAPIPTKMRKKSPTANVCMDCLKNSFDDPEDERMKRLLSQRQPFTKRQLFGLNVNKQVGIGKKAICTECNGTNFHPMYVNEEFYVKGLCCPYCDNLLMRYSPGLYQMENEKLEEYVMQPDEFSTHTEKNNYCYTCGNTLWGSNVKPLVTGEAKPQKDKKWYKISYREAAKEKFATAFVLSGYEQSFLDTRNHVEEWKPVAQEYGPRRVSPAQYIKKYMKGYFDFLILDEVHKFSGHGTSQTTAACALAKASDFVLGMTGTIANGSASSFFSLLYMLDPGRMKDMGYEYGSAGLMKFSQDYGTVETIYAVDENYRGTSRGRVLQQPTSRPGISPKLFIDFLMDKAVFLDLSDLSKYLPPLTESVEVIPMADDLSFAYNHSIDVFKSQLMTEEGAAMGSKMLQFALSYPDKPYGLKPIKSNRVKDCLILDPPSLDEYREEQLLPKEEKLVEVVNEEIAEGRNCFIYCTFTGEGETNISYHLKDLIEKHCKLKGRVQVLEAISPKPLKRERYIKKKASEGIKVFICNPKLVETGLDFCFNYGGQKYNYPTLLFYQMSYELAVIWQASRRAYRLNQTEPCKTIYFAYEGTLQAAALEIMAKKQVATSAIQGKFSTEGLSSMAKGVDAKVMLAQALSENDMSSRETLENMFDVMKVMNNTDDDDMYSDYEPPKTYYEIVEECGEESNDLFSMLNSDAFVTSNDEEKVVVVADVKCKEIPKQETPKKETKESVSDFDSFMKDLLSPCVFNPELLEYDASVKKKRKKNNETAGQYSLLDLLDAI